MTAARKTAAEVLEAVTVNRRSEKVVSSLRGFLLAHVALVGDGRPRRFVYTTSARTRPRFLKSWDEAGEAERVETLRQRLPEKDGDSPVGEAVAWLDGDPERWKGFVRSIHFRFGTPDVEGVRREIVRLLQERGNVLPADLLVDRLVVELLNASRQPEAADRVRTRQNLKALLDTTAGELEAWARTPEGSRARELFDELRELGWLIPDPRQPLGEPTPGNLLTAAHEVIPFETDARRRELEALAGWCAGEARAGVLLLVGEGGVGKTRLMIELCRQLGESGWHTGFLRSHLEAAALRPLFEGGTPRLVVVDYAETRLGVVGPLLGRLKPETGPKLRLVLVARRAGDWWKELRQRPAFRSGPVADASALQLDALDADRAELFERAARAFAAHRGLAEPVARPELTEDLFGRALYLHMAALAAVEGETVTSVAEALKSTLDRERDYWRREVEGLRQVEEAAADDLNRAMGSAVAALTLVGGVAEKREGERLLELATGRWDLSPRERRKLAELLRRLYGREERLEGLQPDPLGEELVAEELKRDPSLLDRVLDVAGDGRASLTVLTRLAQRRPEERVWLEATLKGRLGDLADVAFSVAVETGDPVGMVLAEVVATEGSVELAEGLMERRGEPAYHQSVPLRELAVMVTQKCLDARRAEWPEPSEEQLQELSRLAVNLGARLRALGRREEAFEATHEAVEHYRKLAKDRSDAFVPELATSLNNLGLVLSDLGRREEALKATREAVELRRKLVEARPDAFVPDLATSLNNLGLVLSDLSRQEEAFEATREAIEHYRKLAKARPDAFLPDLAMSLNNLGSDLSDLGRQEEAFEAAREAVKLRRKLAEARPDTFVPDLAMSLNNLGNRLSDLGRREEALEAGEESVRLLLPFCPRFPDMFRKWMGTSTRNYVNHAEALQQEPDAELMQEVAEAMGGGSNPSSPRE